MAKSETTDTSVPAIYAALVAVGAELAKVGIAKDRQNEAQRFFFRGIDQVMNTVSPILAKHDVLMLPTYHDISDTERVTGKGGTLLFTKVRGEYTFISAKDGSQASVVTYGQGMDSGDKALSKAQSMALKAALLQMFLIPTEGSDDADATSPEESVEKPPAGFHEWWADLLGVVDEGLDPLREAWRQSAEVLRNYAIAHRETEWDTAKRRAKAVTDAQKTPKPRRVVEP